MLCPEVWNFPSPKIKITNKQCENLEITNSVIKMNSFYKSLIVTCPDEWQTPSFVEEIVSDDSDYYKLTNCPVTHFLNITFIDKFVKTGSLYCLSTNKNCITQNCVAITPDGTLTLHLLDFIFQTIGLEGTKRPHNYYEIKIDMKTLRNLDKTTKALSKLEELFDFYVHWEPSSDDICPSSIAKYFCDKSINVSVHTMELKKISPTVEEIPSVKDTELEEMVEWIGMLAIEADINPKDDYLSSYSQPESDLSIKTSKISLLIAKGMLTPNIICRLCKNLSEYVSSRDMENYWASISIQSVDDSILKWSPGSPRMFQSHDYSCNIFLTHSGQKICSICQIKYT